MVFIHYASITQFSHIENKTCIFVSPLLPMANLTDILQNWIKKKELASKGKNVTRKDEERRKRVRYKKRKRKVMMLKVRYK